MGVFKFIHQEIKKDKRAILFFLSSLTLLFAAYSKSKKETKDDVSKFIIRRNLQYFVIAPFLAFFVWVFATYNISKWIVAIGGLYAFSRVNEIFIAFIKDATSHLRKEEHASSLKYYERIPLAMKSYVELIILYGVISFVLHFFFQAMSRGEKASVCSLDMWQAIYYSGVTITTLGYGEITPNAFSTQLMAIYEVINGFTLIVVSFAIYVSRSVSNKEYKNP